MPSDNSFNVIVIMPKSKDQANRKLHFDDYKAWKNHKLDILIKYKDIDLNGDAPKILVNPEGKETLSEI